MRTVLRHLKNSPFAHRLLNALLRRALRRARRTGRREALCGGPALYAVERRLREHLARLAPGRPLAASAPPRHVAAAFELARDALVHLRDTAPAHREARQWNTRLRELEVMARSERVRAYPMHAYVQPTSRCNLRCPICPESVIPESVPRTTMSRPALEAVFSVLPWLDRVDLYGSGESLLAESFGELLQAVPPWVESSLTTNGLLLTPATARLLVDGGLKELCVSVDAAKPETYLRMRGTGQLERVYLNVAGVAAYRRKRGSATPKICLNVVAARCNLDELADIVRRAHSLGVDQVGIAYLQACSEEFRSESLFYDQERSDRCMDAVERLGRDLGIVVWTPPRFAVPAGASSQEAAVCREIWERVCFTSDGYMAPCSTFDVDYSPWPAADFFDAWNSPDFVALRRNVHTPAQPRRCELCGNTRVIDRRQEQFHVVVAFVPDDRPGAVETRRNQAGLADVAS